MSLEGSFRRDQFSGPSTPELIHKAHMTIYKVALLQLEREHKIKGFQLRIEDKDWSVVGANVIVELNDNQSIPLYLLSNNSEKDFKEHKEKHADIPIIRLMSWKGDTTRPIDWLKTVTLEKVANYVMSGYKIDKPNK